MEPNKVGDIIRVRRTDIGLPQEYQLDANNQIAPIDTYSLCIVTKRPEKEWNYCRSDCVFSIDEIPNRCACPEQVETCWGNFRQDKTNVVYIKI